MTPDELFSDADPTPARGDAWEPAEPEVVAESEVVEPVAEAPVKTRKTRAAKPVTAEPEVVVEPTPPEPKPEPKPEPRPEPPKRKGGLSLDSLRENTDYRQQAVARRIQLNIPVTKPNRHDYYRTHPSPDYRIDVIRLFTTEDRAVYAVDESVRDLLDEYLQPYAIRVVINRANTVSLWPLRLPQDDDNRAASWHRSAIRAAERMETEWLRIAADMSAGGYTLTKPVDQFPDPVWPEDSLQELVDRAFAHNLIDSLDHPEIKRIQGRL